MAKTRLTADELARNFREIHPAYSRDEAVVEASQCLFCYDAPCTRACPTHIDVPRFIRQILHGNPGGAAETIFRENILGGSCARACPTEVLCEGVCVMNQQRGFPIQIGRLQRYATDHAAAHNLRFFEPGPETGFRVAVVGSGPAGLSCAAELRKAGHGVTIFEARSIPGGLNTLGIAAYKITTEFALSEVEPVRELGAEIRLNTPVDQPMLRKLLEEYDAVFLGLGLGSTASLRIPGEETSGVWEALDFIYQTHTGPMEECHVGRKVIVIGAGNTAVDAATASARLGAEEVTITYRRTDQDMPAYKYEYDLAKSDGIGFLWNASPVEFLSVDGVLAGVRFQRMEQEGEGRNARLRPIPGSEFIVECDMAIKALGQDPVTELLSGMEGVTVEKGKVSIDPKTGCTGIPNLFAGGDCISKGAEIVNAVQEGKVAAHAIHRYLVDREQEQPAGGSRPAKSSGKENLHEKA